MKFLVFATVLVLCVAATFADEEVSPCQRPPAVHGTCRADFSRYSYHSDSNECRRFGYGGCGGNSNNFQTLEACETACKPAV
ncbi:hypothetical protein B566_EDAN008720 [Ephemera danica]|nr:hypothetical protein B566_EDAN008720 [Ephemera danica]